MSCCSFSSPVGLQNLLHRLRLMAVANMPSSRRCAQVLRTSLSAAVPVCGLCISTSHQSVLCCAVCAHKHKHRLPAKPPSAAAYTLTDFHGQATSEQYLVMQPPGEPNSTQSSETRAACTFTRHMKNLCVCVLAGPWVGGGAVCCGAVHILVYCYTAAPPVLRTQLHGEQSHSTLPMVQ